MKKYLLSMILLCGCSQKTNQNITLETLETKTGLALEEEEKKMIMKRNPTTLQKLYRCQSLAVDDIITLSEVGISDNFILCYLLLTKEKYNLNFPEIKKLENHTVSQRVIRHLINTGE